MRDAGFTVVDLMVSLVVVLLVAAGTAAVITYQSRLGVYRVKATKMPSKPLRPPLCS